MSQLSHSSRAWQARSDRTTNMYSIVSIHGSARTSARCGLARAAGWLGDSTEPASPPTLAFQRSLEWTDVCLCA